MAMAPTMSKGVGKVGGLVLLHLSFDWPSIVSIKGYIIESSIQAGKVNGTVNRSFLRTLSKALGGGSLESYHPDSH